MREGDAGQPNQKLREERLRRGWTQVRVADELYKLCEPGARRRGEINANMVGRWERGEYPPSLFYQEKLCIVFGRSAEELGFIEPKMTKEDGVSRRRFNRSAFRITTAASIIPDALLDAELLDRFSKALKKPSSIDERFLAYLEMRTENYWRDRHKAVITSSDLLGYVIEHLQQVITLLERSPTPSMHTRLCCIASGIAQLVGHLLFDMGKFADARNFHRVAIRAAQEGDNRALEAAARGRMSFTWTYDENASEALRYVQEARRLATRDTTTVRAYLAAVEAEIQAILGNRKDCLKALNDAGQVDDQQYSGEEIYWLHFDRSRLAGYQGICFRRLYRPEDARTRFFLDEAQRTLTEALARLDPVRIQRRPTLLIDIAGTYVQKGDIEGACEHALEALPILAQTGSQTAIQRLLTLRQDLEPWRDTQCIKNLDGQIAQLSIPG